MEKGGGGNLFNFNLYTWPRYSFGRCWKIPRYIYIFLPLFAFHIVAKLCITVSHKFPSFSSMRNGYAIFAVSRLLIHRVTLHHFPPSYYYSQNCWGLYRKILLELRFHFAKHSSWRTGFLSQPSSVFSLLSIRREDVLQNRSQEKLVVDRKNFVRWSSRSATVEGAFSMQISIEDPRLFKKESLSCRCHVSLSWKR